MNSHESYGVVARALAGAGLVYIAGEQLALDVGSHTESKQAALAREQHQLVRVHIEASACFRSRWCEYTSIPSSSRPYLAPRCAFGTLLKSGSEVLPLFCKSAT